MLTLIWIMLGLGAWTLCGVLAVAVSCAARRGDRLSSDALMGMDPAVEVAPRPRMLVDAVPVARPWATATPLVGSALVEAGQHS
jgi:hypothetical protein